MNWDYWGKPISPLGDSNARLMIIGLAPAAHGANRTGRIFTGDRSGDWLFRALHRAGFANQAEATSRADGLELRDACVTCIVKCAPPDNRPTPKETQTCVDRFLARELELLDQAVVYVALGQLALKASWGILSRESGSTTNPPHRADIGARRLPLPKFKHGAEIALPRGRALLLSYHPSQQNTFTGRLTEPMLDAVFGRAREIISSL